MDIDKIRPGTDFEKAIREAIENCDTMLVVIGRQWLTATNESGARRLDDPNDYVRIEIALGLRRGIRVIPVLVAGASMPRPQDLPDDLVELAGKQAHEQSDTRWGFDTNTLIRLLNPEARGLVNVRTAVLVATVVLVAVAVIFIAVFVSKQPNRGTNQNSTSDSSNLRPTNAAPANTGDSSTSFVGGNQPPDKDKMPSGRLLPRKERIKASDAQGGNNNAHPTNRD